MFSRFSKTERPFPALASHQNGWSYHTLAGLIQSALLIIRNAVPRIGCSGVKKKYMKMQKILLQCIEACAPLSNLPPVSGYRQWSTPIDTGTLSHAKQDTSRSLLQEPLSQKMEDEEFLLDCNGSKIINPSLSAWSLPESAMNHGKLGTLE